MILPTTVLKDVQFRINTYSSGLPEELKSRKVINEMKIKRNSKRNSFIKKGYQTLIDELEEEHNSKFNK